MDEILLDDKTYLSSKRAAKMTGYAKDYVGQLCREGRVQARLVGRSWYVLEDSIREHRFGNTDQHKTKVIADVASVKQPESKSHTEASIHRTDDILDEKIQFTHLHNADRQINKILPVIEAELQPAIEVRPWETWFDNVKERTEEIATASTRTTTLEDGTRERLADTKESVTQKENFEFMKSVGQSAAILEKHKGVNSSTLTRILRVASVAIATFIAIAAIIGSGSVDGFFRSNGSLPGLSGIHVYKAN